LAVDHDERGPGRRVGSDHHALDADPFGLECGANAAAGGVVADARDQAHLGAETARGDGLVRALAAVVDEQRAAADRLADGGQPGCGDREVDVRRADYEDASRGVGGHRRSRNRRMKRSLSTLFATRQFGAPPARSVSPSGPMASRTVSHLARDGSTARPTASGSWSAIPWAPSLWAIRKPRSLNLWIRDASGPDERPSVARIPARGSTAWRVASRGTTSSGSPAARTRCAASGSTDMLNSAVGVTLPGTSTAPPIATIRPTRPTAAASCLSASARLVRGPSATIVSSRS